MLKSQFVTTEMLSGCAVPVEAMAAPRRTISGCSYQCRPDIALENDVIGPCHFGHFLVLQH
eukprot:scaffold221044_cov72-Attheya_sp.AAC.2